jgi:hypothetical protein
MRWKPNVQQKAADKLLGGNGHDLVAIAVAVIPPAELELLVLNVEDTIIGDGDAVRIACGVFQNLFRSGERRLGIDHQLDPSGGSQIAQEGAPFLGWTQSCEELQLSCVKGLLEIG